METLNLQGYDYPFYQGDKKEILDKVFDPYLEDIKKHINKVGTIIDIGTHFGSMSIILFNNIHNDGLICIEAIPYNVEILKTNLTANNIDATIHQCAIADYNGKGTMRIINDNATWLLENSNAEGNIETPVRTLDSFNLSNISFIKVDIEGAELAMLKGATQTIKNNKPVIYLEHHWNVCPKDELYNFIDSLNYQIINLSYKEYKPNVINQYLLIPNN